MAVRQITATRGRCSAKRSHVPIYDPTARSIIEPANYTGEIVLHIQRQCPFAFLSDVVGQEEN